MNPALEYLEMHTRELVEMIRQHVPTVQDAEDAVQEAALRLLRFDIEHAENARAFAFTAARNAARDIVRKQGLRDAGRVNVEHTDEHRNRNLAQYAVDPAPTPQEIESAAEDAEAMRLALARALATLRPSRRLALLAAVEPLLVRGAKLTPAQKTAAFYARRDLQRRFPHGLRTD